MFQSTHPRGARRRRGQSKPWTDGFNPRARAGRDVHDLMLQQSYAVSIHAPARGATPIQDGIFPSRAVSIHAPARGATAVLQNCLIMEGFQSTRPRGARLSRCSNHLIPHSFNPRARAGRDCCPCFHPCWFEFQSTRPRGARHLSFRMTIQHVSFNPRARAGRDTIFLRLPSGFTSFNPRARAGRDNRCGGWQQYSHVSIHAPARGATFSSTTKLPSSRRFNPRARAGRDPVSSQ